MSSYTGLGTAPTADGLPPGGAPGDVLVLGPGGQPAWDVPAGGTDLTEINVGNGTVANPSLGFQSSTTGFYIPASGNVTLAVGGLDVLSFIAGTGKGLFLSRNTAIAWASNPSAGSNPGPILTYGTGGATALQLGLDASSPFAQVIGIGSRITTDGTGANLTFQAGRNLGAFNGGSLIFQTSTPAAAGVAGTLNTRLTINSAGDIIVNGQLSFGSSWFTQETTRHLRVGQGAFATGAVTGQENTLSIGGDAKQGTDADKAGGNGIIQTGAGTGAGASAALIFKTANSPNNTSATTLQLLFERMRLSQTGLMIGSQGTPFKLVFSVVASVNFASMATATENTQTVSVPGVGITTTGTPSVFLGWAASLEAGIAVMQAWVSGNDVVSIRVRNTTAGTIDPAAVNVRVTVFNF